MDGMEIVYPNSNLVYFNRFRKHENCSGGYALLPWKNYYIYKYGFKKQKILFDAKLLTYANDRGYTLYNYKDSNIQLYYEAFKMLLIIVLLGITAAGIALIIFIIPILLRWNR